MAINLKDCEKCIHSSACRFWMKHATPFGNHFIFMIEHCNNFTPTADVVEVKHGEWFLLDDCANEGIYCSVCHKKVYNKDYANQKVKSPRCPNCGAKMDGRSETNAE